ncbi:glycosyl transferase [Aureococcus anophagefferens]|nr:glycosyl transferase [Aureococcus anophagefferens]
MALLGLLALLAHGGDAAVSVYTPRGPTGLRAAQECADLGSWLAYLGAGACADLGVDAAALGDAKRRHEKELWKGTAAFTISAFNNWGVVRPFLTSLLDHNEHLPGLTWFLADSPHDGDAVVDEIREDFKTLQERYPATDLRLESLDDVNAAMAYDARELALRYDLKCFNTAVKPHVFRMLFDRGYRSVLYFDPDIHFYADFDEVALLLHKRTFVLTPHETRETPDDGEWQTDLQIMRAGVYNYGFLGLSNAYPDVLDHYLAWWAETLRYQGGVDLEAGLHFDQNWAVFVPSFYPEKTYKVLVDPRYNAAYWNLHYRGAEIAYTSDSDVTYGGAPLVFFHFSGVSTDVINFDAISPHQTRYSLGDLPNLRPLLASYAAAVADSAYYREHSRYGLDAFDNGAPAPFWARDLYGPQLQGPPREGGAVGLRAAAVANKDKECAADGPVDDFGVNVVGYVDGVFGVAESSRYLYRGLQSNIPTAAVKLRDTPAYAFRDHGIPTTRSPGFGFNVVVQNADMSHDVAASYPWRQWRRRYNVGYWAYELEKLPERFAAGALIYDEIWATSEFTADAVRSALASDPVTAMIPVKAMPAAVDALAAGWPNIQAIDDRLDDDVFASLKAADCYVSLHRSEGYGLNVLEALLAGTPTIATTYSGNMDFMKHLPKPTLDALGVAWAPKTLDAAVGPYPKGGAWSEPSADDGARAMAHAASHRAEVRAAAQADAATLRAKFSADAQGAVQAARLKAVDGLRRSVPPVPDESIYCYWLKNTDIREALGNDLAAVTAHWNDQGQAEGRELACDWLSAAALQAAKLVLV